MTRRDALFLLVLAWLAVPAAAEDGFNPLFDGKTLTGWHVSGQTGHGTGGRWGVEDGAIVGTQDKPGNGGIVITDKAYGDFEVALEMKNDFGPDSGLFLRSTEKGEAYQAMIDYHAKGNLMGIYGERLSGRIGVANFGFLDDVTKIEARAGAWPLPVSPSLWPAFWKHGEWNELRARIVGNPPTITTWIRGVKWMEWTDTEKRHPDRGGIALQVHGGGDYTKQFVRYRNVRVREMPPAEALWNGKDLGGWEHVGPGKVVVDQGLLKTEGGMGLLWYTGRKIGNAVVRVVYRTATPAANSGLFIRIPEKPTEPWMPVNKGYEVQIDEGEDVWHRTGGLYSLTAAMAGPGRPGEWNTLEITLDGPRTVVTLNDAVVTDYTEGQAVPPKEKDYEPDRGLRPAEGYIGLQNHSDQDVVFFKEVSVRPLR